MIIDTIYQRLYTDGSKGWFMQFKNGGIIKIQAKQAKEIIKIGALRHSHTYAAEQGTKIFYS